MAKKAKSRRKPRLREVTHLEGDPGMGGIWETDLGGEAHHWEAAETFRTKEGKILFKRNYVTHFYDRRPPKDSSETTMYGVIFGFVIPERYKKNGGEAVKVRLLTPTQRRRYQKGLRRRIRGPVNFW